MPFNKFHDTNGSNTLFIENHIDDKNTYLYISKALNVDLSKVGSGSLLDFSFY